MYPSRPIPFSRPLTLLLLFVLGSLLAPSTVQAQLEEKRDSLRWVAMQWYKEGNGELFNWRDSLRLCITEMTDDGSGVRVDLGESEGSSITPNLDFSRLTPGQGLTFVWDTPLKDDPDEVTVITFEEADDPRDGEGSGIDLGVLFPRMGHDTFRLIIWDGDTPLLDSLVVDPGPGATPPDFPFPLPRTPLVWIDTENDSTPCDVHELSNVGPEILPGGDVAPRMDDMAYYTVTFETVMPIVVGTKSRAYRGNRIMVLPHQPDENVFVHISAMRAIPRGIPEVTFIDASIKKFGLDHRGTGEQSLLKTTGPSLRLTDIGRSGLDGIRTALPKGTTGITIDPEFIGGIQLDRGKAIRWTLTPDPASMAAPAQSESVWTDMRPLGSRMFLSLNATAGFGIDEFGVEIVRKGNIIRRRTIPNGGGMRLPGNLAITQLRTTTQAEDGWDGMEIVVARQGREASIRIAPITTGYKEIKWTFSDLTATSRRGPWEIEIASILDKSTPKAPAVNGDEPVARKAYAASASADAPALLGNYPEPFNPTTTVAFSLPEAAPVRLEVFDVTGRRIALLTDGVREAGQHEVRFDASGLASGLYLSRLVTGSHVISRPMLLLK